MKKSVWNAREPPRIGGTNTINLVNTVIRRVDAGITSLRSKALNASGLADRARYEGIPIHLGILFMYSWYASPYFSRQSRSSWSTTRCHSTISVIASNVYIHETQAKPVPVPFKNSPIYMGFLDTRYMPVVTGLSTGVTVKVCNAIISINIPVT